MSETRLRDSYQSILSESDHQSERHAVHAEPEAARGRCAHAVLISEHDYRTRRRANVHPIADALVRLGYTVTFVSIRFSLLSRWKGDSRNFLWEKANTPEVHNQITCYLWKTPLHPFHPRQPVLNKLSSMLYRGYARLPNRFLDEALRAASFIVVESGLGALLLRRARATNPTARITYLASDELLTVGVHPFVQTQLEKSTRFVDQVCVPSPQMATSFRWARDRLFFVPHGLDTADFRAPSDSPYTSPLNAVSVGSMLFDADFFVQAATRFPEIEFHVIGAGATFEAPRNVHIHPEMAFSDTIPFIRHASFGIAPYRAAPGCEYLSDTSMKLMQYEYLGIPAVCPTFAAGSNPRRFAYVPGDSQSIERAIAAALQHRDALGSKEFLSWDDVAERLLNPRAFADTAL